MAGPTLTPSSSENERAPIILSGPPFLLAILRVPTLCQSQLGRKRFLWPEICPLFLLLPLRKSSLSAILFFCSLCRDAKISEGE